MITCLKREYLGGSEDISFDDFVRFVIQDAEAAIEIAERMLENPLETYTDNWNEPEYIERYTITNKFLLEEGIKRYKKELNCE